MRIISTQTICSSSARDSAIFTTWLRREGWFNKKVKNRNNKKVSLFFSKTRLHSSADCSSFLKKIRVFLSFFTISINNCFLESKTLLFWGTQELLLLFVTVFKCPCCCCCCRPSQRRRRWRRCRRWWWWWSSGRNTDTDTDVHSQQRFTSFQTWTVKSKKKNSTSSVKKVPTFSNSLSFFLSFSFSSSFSCDDVIRNFVLLKLGS